MQDLRFNPRERDIYIESGDLDVAADRDTGLQNGFILAGTAMCTPLYPPIGLSLVDAIGSAGKTWPIRTVPRVRNTGCKGMM